MWALQASQPTGGAKTIKRPYAIVKHYSNAHPGQETAEKLFIFRVLGAGHGGNLQRYVAEALHIKEAKEAGEELLNSKGDWARVALKRLIVGED